MSRFFSPWLCSAVSLLAVAAAARGSERDLRADGFFNGAFEGGFLVTAKGDRYLTIFPSPEFAIGEEFYFLDRHDKDMPRKVDPFSGPETGTFRDPPGRPAQGRSRLGQPVALVTPRLAPRG